MTPALQRELSLDKEYEHEEAIAEEHASALR